MSAGVSRGGDMTGIDRYDRLQEPTLHPVDDLTRFVAARIIEAESGTREAFAVHDEPNGAMAHRYAGAVRRDMVVYRRIVAAFIDCYADIGDLGDTRRRDAFTERFEAHRAATKTVANRWADHREFQAEWRIQ